MTIVTVCLVAGATAYVETLPNQYESQALIALGPRTRVGASADTVRVVGPKYVEYLTAPSTIQEIAPLVDESPADIADGVDAELAVDTGNLTITAEMTSPEAAADVANAFADAAVELSDDDRLLSGELLAEALEPEDPSGPPRRLLEGASLLAGLLLGAAIAVVLERGRPRLHSVQDIARVTGHPVVGRIPRFQAAPPGAPRMAERSHRRFRVQKFASQPRDTVACPIDQLDRRHLTGARGRQDDRGDCFRRLPCTARRFRPVDRRGPEASERRTIDPEAGGRPFRRAA